GKASKVTGYMTDILNEHALKFVRAEHQKPFVLYLAHKAVHGPFTPAERHQDLYSNESIKSARRLNDSLEDKPVLTREVEQPAKAPKKKAAQTAARTPGRVPEGAIRNQLRALAAVEEGVGQLLKALEETKQLDNTFFIFSSDNGFFWGEHG